MSYRNREELEKYRHMTASERLSLTLKITEETLPMLLEGPPNRVRRRFELLNRDKDERNRRIVEGLECTSRGERLPDRPTGHAIDEDLAKDPQMAKDIEEWL